MDQAKKIKIITFRVTEHEYMKIEEAAIASGREPNDWCRYTTIKCSSMLLTIAEHMIYKEIAVLRWLFEHGFELIFEGDADLASEWTKLLKRAEVGANDTVTKLLAERKLGSR